MNLKSECLKAKEVVTREEVVTRAGEDGTGLRISPEREEVNEAIITYHLWKLLLCL